MTEKNLRRVDVFFYGYFMDIELLRGAGANPSHPRACRVRGFALRIGQRATLVPAPGGRVHGVTMALTHPDIDALYSVESLRAYRPEAVVCEFEDGSTSPALCYVLTEPPHESERNRDYARKLHDVARRLNLPADYVREIAAFMN